MHTLQANGLAKAYGKKQVLHSINLTLEPGKIYGLIGRNGAGKTTLLSALSAQTPLNAGTVTVCGLPVWENAAALSHLCFARELTPTANSSTAGMKVNQYLQLAAAFQPNWDRACADALIARFGIDVKQRLGKLSRGMQSMVSIVVALASRADFTFLDEPTSGLDIVAREQFYQLLLEDFTQTGRTFVISTHIIEEASDLFEEVIFLKDGNILLKENTQDLLDRALYLSGHRDQVDRVTAGMVTYHPEQFGRSKSVTVLPETATQRAALLAECGELTVQKPSLQKLFVALCGEDAT